MKTLLYIAVMFLAFGCKDEPIDIRVAAFGKYTGSATFYVLDGTTLVQTGIVNADPITVLKGSAADEILIDFGDGDLTTGINVKSSPDGLTFNLNHFTASSFHFTGYPGYESEGVHYDGGFNKDQGKLELWYQYTTNGTIKVTKCDMTKQ